jgi:hypothetical protein
VCFHLAAIVTFLWSVPSATFCGGSIDGNEPIEIRPGETQVFIDDFLIAKSQGLRRTLRQPRKDEHGNQPVIELGDEFGVYTGTLEANGTIVFDSRLGKYVMFALAFSAQNRNWDRARLYRFTSHDGIHWVKGDDGRPQLVYPHSADFFIDPVSKTSATNIDVFAGCYDAGDDKYPYKGWQFFANWGEHREGSYYMRSRDGLTWERKAMVVDARGGHVEQDGFVLNGAGDVNTFAVDTRDGGYLALLKYANPVAIGPGNRQRSRAFVRMASLDKPLDLATIRRVDLVPPAAELDGNDPHDEFYGSSAWRVGSLWVGGLKIWHGGGDHPWSAQGCAYLKLIYSRDGLHWNRVRFENDDGVPEIFIANGPEAGNRGRNDGGYITEFNNPPLRIGDELIHYYGCSSFGKNWARGVRVTGGGIFRARLRPDGYVSVDAGTLVTPPLRITADNLFLNSTGPVRVAVLDSGYREIASARLQDDRLDRLVRFDGASLRSMASNDVVRLSFTVEPGARLYAFTVR